MEIREGDIVTLAQDAVYYTGKIMPDWVKNERWRVKSVGGDRVVINENESGTRAINSPVNVRYVTVAVSAASAGASSPSGAKTAESGGAPSGTKAASSSSAAPAPGTTMQISQRGVELVAKYEGCRLEAYKCAAGVWTIGYGHTAGVNPGDKLPSKEAAKELLQKDLVKYAASVNKCIQKGFLTFQPNQNQFDALTSFCYNCGAGSLQKLVTGRSAAEIAEKMLAYNKGGGRVLQGLVRRREEERSLFLS